MSDVDVDKIEAAIKNLEANNGDPALIERAKAKLVKVKQDKGLAGVDEGVKFGEMAKAAAGDPSALSLLERFGRGIKFSDDAKRGFVEAVTGGKVKEAPEGQFLETPDGKVAPIDPDTYKGSIAALMSTFLNPLAGPIGAVVTGELAQEGFAPRIGNAGEGLKDVADFSGEVIEQIPEALLKIFTKGKKMPKAARLPSEMGAAGAGTVLRRGVSEMLPGEDIGAKETAVQAGIGMAAVPVVEGVIKVGKAVVRAPETVLGKKLLGEAPADDLARAKRVEQAIGADFTPGALTLDADALGFASLLRQAPGVAELWTKRDASQLVKTTKALGNWVKAALGSKVDPAATAQAGLELLRKHDSILDTARKANFTQAFSDVVTVTGNQRVFDYAPLMTTISNLERRGFNMDPIVEIIREKTRTEVGGILPSKLSAQEMQSVLHEMSDMARSKVPAMQSERTANDFVAGKLYEAAKESLSANADNADDIVGVAADALRKARDEYGIASQAIRDSKTELAARILKLSETGNLEHLPREILRKDKSFSDQQVKLVMEIWEKESPAFAQQMRRAVFDEALEGSAVTGSSLLGKRAKDLGAKEGVTTLSPGRVAKQLSQYKDRLQTVIPDKKFHQQMDDIIDGFERLQVELNTLRGSSTAPLLMHNDLMRAVANFFFHPFRSASEMGLYLLRGKLSASLATKEGRDILVGLMKPGASPSAVAIQESLGRLGVIVARDKAMEE